MSMAGGLDSLDHLSSVGISQPNLCELAEEAMAATYSKYSYQMKEDTNNLDINEFKDQVSVYSRFSTKIKTESKTKPVSDCYWPH